jgi:subtilisin
VKQRLQHYFRSLAALALVPVVASAADRPEVILPPGEQPKAFVAFTQTQRDDTIDWSVTDAKIPDVWAKGITGKGFVVGVIDTGTEANHPDIAGQEIGGRDYTGKGNSGDGNGHGTWCAGHIVGKKDGKGTVGGAYGAKLRTYKALSDGGSGSNAWIARAIDDAVRDGCHVCSLSLGSSQPDPLTLAAIGRGLNAGVIFAIAAGNEGPREGTVGFPGGFAARELPLIVCVAAHDKAGATAVFSSRGKAVTVTAGGVDTLAPWIKGQYAAIDGTSMATPLVAALALLWLEAGGSNVPAKERPAAFLDALTRSCDRFPQRNTSRGFGKPDANKLIAAATPPAPVLPVPPPLPPVVGDGFTGTITQVYRDGKLIDVKVVPATPAPKVEPIPQPKASTPGTIPYQVWPTPAPQVVSPVPGYWSPPAQPWYPPVAQPIPQYMPPRSCPPGGCQPCPQPIQWQPFGGRFR